MLLLAGTAIFASAPVSASALPPIKHVFIIVLENQNEATSFGSGSQAPYLAQQLPAQGELVPNYYGIGHESNDNYLAMISGQAPNVDTQADCQFYTDVLPGTVGGDGQAIGTGCVYPAAVQTVAGQLQAAGRSWKGYMEDMGNTPSRESATCAHPANGARDGTQTATAADQYAARHDPFVYFHSIVDTPACQQDVVPLSRLTGDLASATTTATYSFISPNLCDDGHDSPCANGQPGGLVSANGFLKAWVPRITSSPAYRDGGLLIVTFDEAASDSSACCGEQPGPGGPDPGGPSPGPGGGKVGAVLLSPYIQPGSLDPTAYNHYSMLRSIEDLFGLEHLGFAAASGLQAFGADVFNRPNGAGGATGKGGKSKRFSITVSGSGRACVRAPVSLRVRTSARVRKLVVSLDGRRLARSRRSSLRITIRTLRGGPHRLRVRAVDTSGHVHRLRRSLRACSTRPRRASGPTFVG